MPDIRSAGRSYYYIEMWKIYVTEKSYAAVMIFCHEVSSDYAQQFYILFYYIDTEKN